ncbi:glutamine synthetase [Philodulcilactobacillus myokoensis]|uniref:Glutamine synthetase n=1 Tax=Philodulcilactobacillus myokoensis TaxID=2929573 RepID=A0A9W6B0L5_9LACO|nr:MerR family transcriptional regulator [Philodulcilactobacillus myokoensis]GLB46789.1 glutamine synthetase [Philodulcilactobacillus myokoensis]
MEKTDLHRSLSVLPMGTVMKLTDLSARQIRYYEQQQLIFPKRNKGNQRLFSLNDVDKIIEIKNFLSNGMNIADIKHVYKKYQLQKKEKQHRYSKRLTDNETRRLLIDDILTAGGFKSKNPKDQSF